MIGSLVDRFPADTRSSKTYCWVAFYYALLPTYLAGAGVIRICVGDRHGP